MNNELNHHGIKGQKWGVRRFQNKDGSLTPTGKHRYGDGQGVNLQDTKKLVDKSNEVAKQTQRISEDKRNKKEKIAKKETEEAIRDHVSKMSDQELRDVVNRLNMEERYTQVMRDRTNIEIGKTKTEKFMDYAVTALTIASTTLTIMQAIKELKK